jgi:subtilisin family serine protease
MAVSIISNKKNTSATIHVSVANTTIKVSGNSVTTNVDATSTCLAVDNEVLSGAYITQAFWGIDPNGYAVIKRGTTPVAIYDSTGYKDYAGNGLALTVAQTANLTVEFVGTANAYVLLEVQKVGTFTSDYNNT